LLLLLFCLPHILAAQAYGAQNSDETGTANHDTTQYFFYHALPYGSQATYNPMNVIINGGYGILQIPNYDDEYGRKIFT